MSGYEIAITAIKNRADRYVWSVVGEEDDVVKNMAREEDVSEDNIRDEYEMDTCCHDIPDRIVSDIQKGVAFTYKDMVEGISKIKSYLKVCHPSESIYQVDICERYCGSDDIVLKGSYGSVEDYNSNSPAYYSEVFSTVPRDFFENYDRYLADMVEIRRKESEELEVSREKIRRSQRLATYKKLKEEFESGTN